MFAVERVKAKLRRSEFELTFSSQFVLSEMLSQRIIIVWFAKTNIQSKIMNATTMMPSRRILKSLII